MRRRTVVAVAALIAALALAGLPVPVGSRAPSATRDLAPAAFTSVTISAAAPALPAGGVSDAASETGRSDPGLMTFSEAAAAPSVPTARPTVDQPVPTRRQDWKQPRQVLTGFASFYDTGDTAMRLPKGTVVRICGKGGCIERVITDYGPSKKGGRIIDMYRRDFFQICGCASWSGTTKVTVSIY